MAPFKVLLILLVTCTFSVGFQYSDDGDSIPYSTIRMRRRLYAKRRHRNICNIENDDKNNEKLKEVVGISDYVFTGKVVSYYVEENSIRELTKRDNEKRGKRRRNKKIKTKTSTSTTSTSTTTTSTTQSPDEKNSIDVNFNFDEEKSQTFIVEIKRVIKGGDTIPGISKVIVNVPKEFVSGLEITSDSVLNTNCVEFHPVLKLRSTAILLARRLNGTEILQLTTFPVAMTLRHLDRVDAAVSGIKFFDFEGCEIGYCDLKNENLFCKIKIFLKVNDF